MTQENHHSFIVLKGKAAKLLRKCVEPYAEVLDVGSDGYFASFLSDYRVVSVNKNEVDLNQEWRQQWGVFDAVTAWNVLEHLENPYHFFREAYRALKPNGWLLISIPDFTSIKNKIHFLLHNDFNRYDSNPFHITPFLPSTLARACVGFTLQKQFRYGKSFVLIYKKYAKDNH